MALSALSILKSKTRAAILKIFFNNTDGEYYLRQLEGLIGYSVGNIRREMLKLEKDGLFITRNIGKTKLYAVNKAYLLYREIRDIVRKTIGIEGGLKDVLQEYNDIRFAFIHGSYAEAREHSLSDIDVVIIGEAKPQKVKAALFEYQNNTGREINSIVYTGKEFLDKVYSKNHFVRTLVSSKKIFVKGNQNEFRRFIQIRKTQKIQNKYPRD